MKTLHSVIALLLSAAVILIGAGLTGALIRLADLLPRPMPGAVLGTGVVLELSPFNNVVATGVATVDLANLIGRTVDRIILQLGGTTFTKAMLTNIRLLANDKPIIEDTGTIMDLRQTYRGIAAAATFLVVDLAEIRAHNDLNKYAGSLDTLGSGVKKLVLEATITGATAPTLAGKAMVRRSPQTTLPRYNQLIAKVINRTQNFAAAGEFPLAMAFQKHPNSFIKRVHLSGTTVTAARVKKTTQPQAPGQNPMTDEIFKATDAQNDFVQTEFGRTPQANLYTIDFMTDGNVQEALPLGDAQAMEWYATVSGAGNVVIVSEMLDPLSNN